MKTLCPVILCGGSGTRLWPLSRRLYPKQFMDLAGRTLFGNTVARAGSLPQCGTMFISCHEDHRFFAAAELQRLGVDARIVLEPLSRNTGPAIALAAFAACAEHQDPLLLVLPSDHTVEPLDAFTKAVAEACITAESGYLVTFGIVPQGPETGFGYIKQGEPLSSGYVVERFVEKPDEGRARAMLNEGGFFWNSGMFVFKASVYLEELQKLAPSMYEACFAAWEGKKLDLDFIRVGAEAFAAAPSVSIDTAVMEHTARAAMIPLSAFWSDLGSWEAFHDAGSKDRAENCCVGDIVAQDSHGCYLHSTGRLVAAIGVSNLVLVETPDAVLVADRACSQDVKKIVEHLHLAGRTEKDTHLRVFRPWGNYEVLAAGEGFQVKRIVVSPGSLLSLQLHHHRAEHWVVVSGTARVTLGEQALLLSEDQSTYIPLGTVHRLENPGRIPLVIIEIQTGRYLGEDDIVRLDDTYGRGIGKGV